jgi:transcriptional regulator with XRE-family HTH domain
MKLQAWLEKTKTTQLEFAEKSGVPQPLVSRYAREKSKPKAHYIIAIQEATDGAVSLSDWDLKAAKSRTKRAA